VGGMHDLMPEAYAQHAYITSTAARLAWAYACREIATPVVERAEVFQRTLGTDSDVVCSRASPRGLRGSPVFTR
jgi:histidyl-tRNA synthetase